MAKSYRFTVVHCTYPPLKWISSHKKVCFFIDADFTDDADLKRQMKKYLL